MLRQMPFQTGWIEVVCGSMFSGKTEELIRRINLAKLAKQRVVLFKPHMDERYAKNHVVSHDQRKVDATNAKNANDILELSRKFEVIGIDEAQFFGLPLIDVCEQLATEGKRVIVCGLDQDYRGIPYEPIPQLLAKAEYVSKLHAICVVCGNPANKTQRTSSAKERVVIGGTESYEARCRRCHQAELTEETSEIKLSVADA